MSAVRTVLGDVPAAELGWCYAHEHLIIGPSFTTHVTPDFLLDDVDRCVEELSAARAAGVGAMVDSMPGGGAGRDVRKLAEASLRSGVHVLCPTGLHLAKYYPPGHWSQRMEAEALAELFAEEIEAGIDANDLAGPDRRPTAHRAGLIKVAGGMDRLSEHERKVFRAAAMAHRRTGAPILTHTEQGTAGMEQVELLRSLGVELRHVVLSHCDRRPEVAYQRALLRTGVRLEYDSAFRWKAGEGNPTLDLVTELLPEFPDQIMLGMDAARRGYWRSYGGAPGLDYLLRSFVPMLRGRGVDDELIRRAFVATPADAYALARG